MSEKVVPSQERRKGRESSPEEARPAAPVRVADPAVLVHPVRDVPAQGKETLIMAAIVGVALMIGIATLLVECSR